MTLRHTLVAFALFVGLGGFTFVTPVQQDGLVYRVPVTGVIELGLAPYLERSLEQAAESGAAFVVLDIDTPGGRVDAAERISDAIREAKIPVYALVNRRAFSAGALIALSTDGVYMRPGSVIGAATPVDGTGTKASEKIVSAMRSEMRALAEARGLDPAVAEAMVDEALAIDGVVEEGKLLTLTTSEAAALGYAEEIADLDALMTLHGASAATVVTTQVNWAERVVRFLSHPVVAPFLLSLGFLGLLVEIKTPAFGMAGVAGLLSLSLFFGSHLIIGLAGLEDIMVFGAGLVLVGVEVFIIPGFGLFGVLGGVAILGGLYMSLLGTLPTMPDFTRAGLVLTTTMLVILVTSWALLRSVLGNSRLARSGVLLLQRTGREIGYESAARRNDLVGHDGTAITDLRPSGTALFGDERIDVVSESEWIPEGTPVRVVSAEGYRRVVRPLEAKQPSDDEA
jgi:membrane-bound serine protease (ClpP class)